MQFYSEYLSNAKTISLLKKINIEPKSKSVGIPSSVLREVWEQTYLYVLHNASEVEPYIEVHKK